MAPCKGFGRSKSAHKVFPLEDLFLAYVSWSCRNVAEALREMHAHGLNCLLCGLSLPQRGQTQPTLSQGLGERC